MGIIGRIFGSEESKGSANDYNATCMMCGGGIYSRDMLLSKQSIYVQAGLSGKAREIESAQGYRCKSCGGVYCKRCLEARAPSNGVGGKACPSCGGNFGYLT